MIRRVSYLWRELTGSLWFVPGLFVLGAIVLASVLVEFSAQVDAEVLRRFPRFFGAGADGARSMLATIAGSMITVTGVTFSITVVAVSQASNQYSPRILRNFMRDRPNQIVLGVLAGIFVYCLVVLRTIRGVEELKFIPTVAVLTAVVLAVVGVGFLVYFIHHIAETMEAGSILERITGETIESIDWLFPDDLGHDPEEGVSPNDGPEHMPDLSSARWHALPARQTGYIQELDNDGLLEFARSRKAIIRMERGIGEFCVEGTALVSLANGTPDDDDVSALNDLFTVSAHRTVHQDAAFGVRQIVDIAVKALSPGINDTTTAISCVDHLGAVLVRLARRRIATPYRYARGELHVIAKGATFESLLKAALDEIRQHGAGNVSVLARQLAILEPVALMLTSDRRRALIRAHATLIWATAERSIPLVEDRADVAAAYDRLQHALDANLIPSPRSRSGERTFAGQPEA
jgi:uncharacterized membrane protein